MLTIPRQPALWPDSSSATSARRWLAVFVVAVPLASGLWLGVGHTTFVPFLVLPIFAALAAVSTWPEYLRRRMETNSRAERLFCSAVVVLPSAVFFVTMSGAEFPFLGDHDYHLTQAATAAGLWAPLFIPTLILVVLIAWLGRSANVWWLVGVLTISLPFAAALVAESYYFPVRYPGSFYFLSAPMTLLEWKQPLDALRATNLLAILAWLLILRPIVNGRGPDVGAAMFSLFYFWQKDTAYYFTSSYLEPWSIVFVLTAIEHVLLFGAERPWVPLLLAGAGSMFKEQAFMAIPFLTIALLRKREPQHNYAVAITSAVAAAPFFIYMIVRRAASVGRRFSAASLDEIVDPERLSVWMGRVHEHLGLLSILAVALVLWTSWYGLKTRRPAYVAIAAAAVFQILFFLVDRQSLEWSGYPRFHLLSLAMIGSPLLVCSLPKGKAVLLAVAILSCNAVPLAITAARASDEVSLNFFEHADAPVFFPVREVLRPEFDGAIRVVSDIKSVRNSYDLGAFVHVYPEYAETKVSIVDGSLAECVCENGTSVLGLFVASSPYDRRSKSEIEASEVFARRCLAALRSSCGLIRVAERDSRPIAVFGSFEEGAVAR